MNNKALDKANKAARLAISEEQLGNEQAAEQAARTAGALYHTAGLDLDQAFTLVGGKAALTWSALVDGWYAAA